MKPTELLKVAAIAVLTSGMIVGCQQSSTSDDMETEMAAEEECQGATPEVRNAIYAAKLKNARARNLGAEWEENAKIIEEAEQAAADCQNVRAKILANKAEDAAAEAIAALQSSEPMAVEMTEEPASTEMADTSPYLGGYLVVSGDSLWSISGQNTIYGDPYMWPLIYKTNSGQIKDADLIYPGQYFYIPKAKGPERAAAIEHARNRGAWTIGVTEASDLQYLAQ
ncbi:MAG: LysM peptidoglycan-binding domain-containing protein [Gammaproteobacteria bacterium]|nr:LysM peptidoglycan-binding domain-containing protein [Gammaproteobacteria bacterium]MDH3534471.1 LysM peptidoglycan-binding domain-containing protein [Gammaproteobacteria bacterium]